MLIKLTCVAIVIAVACIQMGHGAEELKKEEDNNSQRSKRALYYQNDLLSNQERQLRAQYPLGVGAAYDYGILPAYDYYYYDYLYDPFYPFYPVYPFYDYYYDYYYDDLLFPLSAKTKGAAPRAAAAPATAGATAPGTRNLSGRRMNGGAGSMPLSHHGHGGHPQAFAHMNSHHASQHQQFGQHQPHRFGQPAGFAAPLPSLTQQQQQAQYGAYQQAPPSAASAYLPPQPPAAANHYDFDMPSQPSSYASSQGQRRLQDKFNAIKLASSKGESRARNSQQNN